MWFKILVTIFLIFLPFCELYSQSRFFWGTRIEYSFVENQSGKSSESKLEQVFKYDLDNDLFDIVYTFPENSPNLFRSSQRLFQKFGYLYGVIPEGGEYNQGLLYCIEISTGNFTKLHDFTDDRFGNWPNGDLVEYKGRIYGTAFWSGIWSYDLIDSTYVLEHDFRSRGGFFEGSTPNCGLILHNDMLYGVNQFGGIYDFYDPSDGDFYNEGTVFGYDPNYQELKKLGDFRNDLIGIQPTNKLLAVGDHLFGVTSGQPSNLDDNGSGRISSLYSCNINDSSFQSVIKFNELLIPNTDWYGSSELYLYENKILGFERFSSTLYLMDTATYQVETVNLGENFREVHGILGDDIFLTKGSSIPATEFYSFNIKTEKFKLLNQERFDNLNGYNYANGILFGSDKQYQTIAQFEGDTILDLTYSTSIQFSAFTDSGLQVSITSNDPEHVSIENGRAYFDHTGNFEIIAEQEGNEEYFASIPQKKVIRVIQSEKIEEPILLSTENDVVVLHINIYPNPASSHLNVSINDDIYIERISIYDISGKLTSSFSITPSLPLCRLPLNLSNGYYLVEVRGENGIKGYSKLLVETGM